MVRQEADGVCEETEDEAHEEVRNAFLGEDRERGSAFEF